MLIKLYHPFMQSNNSKSAIQYSLSFITTIITHPHVLRQFSCVMRYTMLPALHPFSLSRQMAQAVGLLCLSTQVTGSTVGSWRSSHVNCGQHSGKSLDGSPTGRQCALSKIFFSRIGVHLSNKSTKTINNIDYYPYRAFGGQNKIVYSRGLWGGQYF